MGDWNNSKGNDRSSILAAVLPEYQTISSAPTGPSNVEENPEAWKRREQDKRYKAIDRDGNIFLITNPACWKSQIRRWFVPDQVGESERAGERGRWIEQEVKFRPPPQFMMGFGEAKKMMEGRSLTTSVRNDTPLLSGPNDQMVSF